MAWDGGASYTFNEDGSYLLEAYDVEAGHSSYTYNYTISDGVITTTTPYGSTSYKIVRLDRYIMEWQKVGTEFFEGTLISDYKRFKRKLRRVKGDLSIILSDAIWSRMMSINIPDLFRL